MSNTKAKKQLPVVVISPEAYGLPKEMDPMAQYVSRRGGGGLGDVTRGILQGLHRLGNEVYYIGPNYKTIFKENAGLNHEEYIAKMKKTTRDRTLLVSSPHFTYLKQIYDGNVVKSAALLQELAIPHIKDIDRRHGGKTATGKSIVHTQDQFGGIIPAFCKSRNIPTVHTLHNGFTYLTPYDYYTNVDLTDGEWGLKKYMYEAPLGSNMIDSHATAVKNADIITFVGKRFYEEILEGRYKNWDIFASAQNTFKEVVIKAEHNQARVV
ncbi:MAG TPA: glycogen/starch synthase, partial [Alphaproteobacteria bacterium]|nr:glycogen/starch synthase [Alphaproteobacteria bacterium]